MSDPSSCPPLRNFFAHREYPLTCWSLPHIGCFSRHRELAALRHPTTKGGLLHYESAHSVSGDGGGGFDGPRHARIRRGHHDPGRSLLQTGSSESASAGGSVQRGHGHSGGRDGQRRVGARFQLPADQLREPGISAGIYDRLRSGNNHGGKCRRCRARERDAFAGIPEPKTAVVLVSGTALRVAIGVSMSRSARLVSLARNTQDCLEHNLSHSHSL
jgi:hypothetical protein